MIKFTVLLKRYRKLRVTFKVEYFLACYSVHELMLSIYQHTLVNMAPL